MMLPHVKVTEVEGALRGRWENSEWESLLIDSSGGVRRLEDFAPPEALAPDPLPTDQFPDGLDPIPGRFRITVEFTPEKP